ncbi:MAG: hypothetical protein K6A43_00065 [Treponema sp.]|nr:hypothetical protein [Treponema sp.]
MKKSIIKNAVLSTILAATFTSVMAVSFTDCASTSGAQKSTETKKNPLTHAESIDKVPNLCPAEILQVNLDYDYGLIKHDMYFSTTCNRNRGYNIFLPASYDNEHEYPVLYMLHGIFGNEYSFTGDQSLKIRDFLSNMGCSGLSEEMIVVFPDMFAASDPNAKPGFDEVAVANYDNFINDLTTDLMPYIEGKYKVKTGRENTAICGFSMGGRETLYISIMRSDLFNYVGAIAPAPGVVPGRDWAMQHKGQMTEDEFKYSEPLPKLVMICCGTNDGTVGQFPKSYHNLFVKNGVDHYWYEVIGADHNNIAIQSGLFHFLQFVFR